MKDITTETLIEDDLEITGEEASELIQNFSRRYNIDLSAFNISKYFNEEPSILSLEKNVKPFKVFFLEKAILKGRLDEEVINS